MTDTPELAAIRERDAYFEKKYMEVDTQFVFDAFAVSDRRTLLRLLDEARNHEATWAMRHERETAIADKATARVAALESALREIADFAEQFIADDEDGDERMYKVHQIAERERS